MVPAFEVAFLESHMRAPTKARFLNDSEWAILTSVYGDTLPLRYRILVTDALAADDRAFAIPTAAISVLTIPAAVQSAFLGVITACMGSTGKKLAKLINKVGAYGAGALPSQIAGMVNLGYLVNIGPKNFANMATSNPRLLVHELGHVWQGSNSWSAMTYVNNSIMNQCRASLSSASDGGAYDYRPGEDWSSYGAEQQASIIDSWYAAGMPQSGDLWPYIRDYVRKGKT
jgi:hypothetical protein